jgi:hypothetical protein
VTIGAVTAIFDEYKADPYILQFPAFPELHVRLHRIEKPFAYYVPGLVERYQLTPFSRCDTTTYIGAQIALPDSFPTISEEQPVRQRDLHLDEILIPEAVVPPIITPSRPAVTERKEREREKVKDKDVQQSVASDLKPIQIDAPAKLIYHPREIAYFQFDPVWELRPQPMDLPELEDESGRASILALTASEYESLTMTGKNGPYAPFEFTGVTKFADTGFKWMTGPDQVDLRELETDDDIDGIDVRPKPRPITDFMTKQLNTKDKAHALLESVSDGQSGWRDRQRKGVLDWTDKMKNLNSLMRDKKLMIPMDDLLEYLKK